MKQAIIMNLMMYIGNDLIESVALDDERISKPGYLGNFKRNLKEKYHELLQQHLEGPDFFVIDLNPSSPSMSTKK